MLLRHRMHNDDSKLEGFSNIGCALMIPSWECHISLDPMIHEDEIRCKSENGYIFLTKIHLNSCTSHLPPPTFHVRHSKNTMLHPKLDFPNLKGV